MKYYHPKLDRYQHFSEYLVIINDPKNYGWVPVNEPFKDNRKKHRKDSLSLWGPESRASVKTEAPSI